MIRAQWRRGAARVSSLRAGLVSIAAAAMPVLMVCSPAAAQLLDRYYPANVSAYQDWFASVGLPEDNEGFEPKGISVGTFTLRPSIAEGISFDSNPTGVAGKGGSSALSSTASLQVDTDWTRNSINAALWVDDMRYLDAPRLSYTNWSAALGGTVTVADNAVRFGYSHFNTVTLPTQIGTFGLQTPVTDVVDDLRVSDTIGEGPLILVPSLIGQIYRFSANNAVVQNAQNVLNGRDAITGSLTTGYEFAGGHNLVLILSDSHVVYDSNAFPAAPPDFDDASIVGGLEYRPSAVFAYRALGGYEKRFLEGAGAHGASIAGPAAELDVIWSPTELLSLTGRLTHQLQDEPTSIAQGLTETSGMLTLDYAFRRNVALQASAGYSWATFPNQPIRQSSFTFAVEADWKVSDDIILSLRDDFAKADENEGPSPGFTRNVVLLQIKFQR